jgi:hypothetical protein
MPAGEIDELLDIWAASQIPFGAQGPFHNSRDLYQSIDNTTVGNVPWQSFTLNYQGDIPADNPPSWMTHSHEVWYRDPHQVIKNMLANTDFNGEMDTAPFREYDEHGNREYSDFMSGEWAWEQAVCSVSLCARG